MPVAAQLTEPALSEPARSVSVTAPPDATEVGAMRTRNRSRSPTTLKVGLAAAGRPADAALTRSAWYGFATEIVAVPTPFDHTSGDVIVIDPDRSLNVTGPVKPGT